MSNIKRIDLSAADVEYLKNARFLPKDLATLLAQSKPTRGGTRILEIDLETAMRFRDEFMDQMTLHGFDKDYRPNDEGARLGDLIDHFFNAIFGETQ